MNRTKFDMAELTKELNKVGILIENIEKPEDTRVFYVNIEDSNIKYLKFPQNYDSKEKNHCINIYSGKNGDTKNGFWWNHEIDYKKLANELLQYHTQEAAI